ncbi:MAG: hypothetical protein U0169_22015 [Polyangiaceae bacterium]
MPTSSLRTRLVLTLSLLTCSATAFAGAAAFDKAAAQDALKGVDLSSCKSAKMRSAEGHVRVTFETSGKASAAEVNEGPAVGTKTAECISSQYLKAKVPTFSGNAVRVGAKFKMQ